MGPKCICSTCGEITMVVRCQRSPWAHHSLSESPLQVTICLCASLLISIPHVCCQAPEISVFVTFCTCPSFFLSLCLSVCILYFLLKNLVLNTFRENQHPIFIATTTEEECHFPSEPMEPCSWSEGRWGLGMEYVGHDAWTWYSLISSRAYDMEESNVLLNSIL